MINAAIAVNKRIPHRVGIPERQFGVRCLQLIGHLVCGLADYPYLPLGSGPQDGAPHESPTAAPNDLCQNLGRIPDVFGELHIRSVHRTTASSTSARCFTLKPPIETTSASRPSTF